MVLATFEPLPAAMIDDDPNALIIDTYFPNVG
jgi:hypothetical protein